MSDLVTGEAVVLGLRAAKLPSRALAVALDLLVEGLGFLLAAVVFAVLAVDIDGAAVTATLLAMTVFFLVAVPVMVETLSGGRSLGKLALGLRVVRRDGGPVRFRHALVRGLVGFFEIISLSAVPAVISSLVSQDGRRLGDIFAGTLVVRERVPGAGRGGPSLPPVHPQLMQALGGELVALDLSAVPDGLWLAVRQLLGRLGQLDPQVAQSMALRLAGDLASRTGHPAPQGVHPAAYLGAVLAERQRREWARATGAHQQAVHQQAQPQGFQQQTPYPQPGEPPVRVNAAWAAQRPAPAPAPPAPPAPLPQQAAQPALPQPATPQPQPQPGTGFAPPG
ncbi:RDD family protein [Kitasatospora sp. NPDC057223]|uniref:RDD family protein n=1 Tax=Kitasatospora sp. NPDC057223 TaxID=3346055 RepID=UPI00364137E5